MINTPEEYCSRYADNYPLWMQEVMGAKITSDQKVVADGFIREHFVSAKSGTTTGKAQPLSEPVLTPTGFVPMGSLTVGDFVVGSDGKPTEVLGVFPQGEQEVWQIAFSDSTTVRCTDDHLWLTQSFNERKHHKPFTVKSLNEVRQKFLRYDGRNSHLVPNVSCVEFNHQSIPVDAYLMGVLLGDAGFTDSVIKLSAPDKFIFDRVTTLIPTDCSIRHINKDDYRLNGLAKHLRGLRLLDYHSFEKHIPDCFKYNSVEVRLGVIRGLMDTDGTLDYRTGDSPYLCTTSKWLAEDFAWLVRSIGGWAKISEKESNYTYKGECLEGRLAYYVKVVMPDLINPFSLPRKADCYRKPGKYTGKRFMCSVRKVGVEQCQCIKVAAADSLYVTNGFILTHNTTLAATKALWFLTTRVESKVVCTAPTGHQLEDLLFAEMESWIRKIKVPFIRDALVVIKNKIYIKNYRDWFIAARTIPKDAKDKLGDVLAGFHAPHLLFIIDEASGVPDAVFSGIEGSMIQKNVFCLMVGNPTRAYGFFFDSHNKNKRQWFNATLSSINSPFVDQTWIDRMRELYGEESDWYRTKILGKFPLGTGQVVATYEQILEANERWEQFDLTSIEHVKLVAGLDPGAGQGDSSILTFRRGPYIYKPDRIKHKDTNDLITKVTDHCRGRGAAELYTEYAGLGISIFDQLKRKSGFKTYKVVTNARANDPEAYRNIRAELYKEFSNSFDDLALPYHDRYVQELPEIYFDPDKEPLQVVDKHKLKNRLGFSPDFSDSAMLSTYRHFDLGKLQYDETLINPFAQMNSKLTVEPSFAKI